LTGWDIDILTPPEFQAGVKRIDTMLKSIGGITPEMIDKVVALGLIDVRDIEEVGVGPLMEELGLDEALATLVVEKCAVEAKIVAVEQEAKKAADQKAKARGGGPNPLLAALTAGNTGVAEEIVDASGADGKLPGSLEATEGMAPEITTHDESAVLGGGDLSPEEQAIQGVTATDSAERGAPDEEGNDGGRDNVDAAALAEENAARPAGE
jgi:hypothetical protein